MNLLTVGIDDVGRGPLAGPESVCAVVIKRKLPKGFFKGIKNSKALSSLRREEWYRRARAARKAGLIDYHVASSSADFIDQRGIVSALRAALSRSLRLLKLDSRTSHILLDGSLYAPKKFRNQKTIIRGDEKIPVIALASIIAKVSRDRWMRHYAGVFPRYGFDQHVGYGTAAHYRAIKKHGLSKIHRRSFLTAVFKLNIYK